MVFPPSWFTATIESREAFRNVRYFSIVSKTRTAFCPDKRLKKRSNLTFETQSIRILSVLCLSVSLLILLYQSFRYYIRILLVFLATSQAQRRLVGSRAVFQFSL